MERRKSEEGDGVTTEGKAVGKITEPAGSVPIEASVKGALDEIKTQGTQSSAVTNDEGKLLGTVSKDQMNRKVGGLGHDPETSPVEPQMDKEGAYCFEDQTLGEAEKVMRDSKVDEVPVVNRKKILVGKTNLGAIEREKKAENGK